MTRHMCKEEDEVCEQRYTGYLPWPTRRRKPTPRRTRFSSLPTTAMVQTGQQSYEAFRRMLNLPQSDQSDPESITAIPLPKLPIPPFEVPASVAAEVARVAAAEELGMEEMTLQQGASRDATQSPKTCKLRLDNF